MNKVAKYVDDDGLQIKSVEIDSIQAVKACNFLSPFDPVGLVVEDIFNFIECVLVVVLVCCAISRWANSIAHRLARLCFAQNVELFLARRDTLELLDDLINL